MTEKVFLFNNLDSAAIILTEDLIRRCEESHMSFVKIGHFVSKLNWKITLHGYLDGGPLSFSSGKTTHFNERNFIHSAGSRAGNSGSLIF